jgi:hypothetical protein
MPQFAQWLIAAAMLLATVANLVETYKLVVMRTKVEEIFCVESDPR